MAKHDIQIGLDGEKEFKNALKSITLESKALNAEMKAVTSTFDKNTTAEEKNKKTTKLLEDAQGSYQKKLDKLKDRIDEATEKLGNQSDYVQQLKADYYKTEAEMNKMTASVGKMAEVTEEATDSSLGFGDVLKANFLSGVLQKGLETIASKFVEMGKAVIEMGLNVASLADELNTLSKTTSLSTETIQEFRYASSFLDVSESTLTGSLTKLTKTMYSASTGTKSAVEAFEKLHVEFRNGDGSLRNSYDVFLDIIDALGKIDDEVTRDGIAMSVFGKSAQELNPLIIAGSGRLADLAEEAHNVGYVMDEETINALAAVQDEIDGAKLQFEALKNEMGRQVAPVIHEVIEALKDFVAAVDWQTVGQIVYAALMVVVGAFEAAYYIVKTVIDIFIALGNTMQTLPDKFSELSAKIKTKMTDIKETVKGAFKSLVDSALNWGRDMIQGFINGIMSKLADLRNAASNLAGTVASFMHFSKPDEGPLRNYEQWMPHMVEGLRRSLEASSYKLENAVAGMAGGVRGGMAISLGGITINGVADESQIDRMVNQIERKLGRRLYR